MHVRLLVASANLDVLRDPCMSHDVYRKHGKHRHAELTEHWLRTGLESSLTSHWLRTHCALTKRAHVAPYPPWRSGERRFPTKIHSPGPCHLPLNNCDTCDIEPPWDLLLAHLHEKSCLGNCHVVQASEHTKNMHLTGSLPNHCCYDCIAKLTGKNSGSTIRSCSTETSAIILYNCSSCRKWNENSRSLTHQQWLQWPTISTYVPRNTRIWQVWTNPHSPRRHPHSPLRTHQLRTHQQIN